MKAPAFQFYPKDFTQDPMVLLLTTEQVGAYWLLICTSWGQEEPGTLPNDDAMLAGWARLAPRQWAKHRAAILRCFKILPDGTLVQKRLYEERLKQIARREERQEAGSRGGQAKQVNRLAQLALPPSSEVAQLESGCSSATVEGVANPTSASASSSASSSASAKPEETASENAHARSRVMGAITFGRFQVLWGANTGELMPDAHQLELVLQKLDGYAQATARPLHEIADEAHVAFREEVETWTERRPLTAKLFNAKWSEIQVRMGGKVPNGSSVLDEETDRKARELLG